MNDVVQILDIRRARERWADLPSGSQKLAASVPLIASMIDYFEFTADRKELGRDEIGKALNRLRVRDFAGAGDSLLMALAGVASVRARWTFDELRTELRELLESAR